MLEHIAKASARLGGCELSTVSFISRKTTKDVSYVIEKHKNTKRRLGEYQHGKSKGLQ